MPSDTPADVPLGPQPSSATTAPQLNTSAPAEPIAPAKPASDAQAPSGFGAPGPTASPIQASCTSTSVAAPAPQLIKRSSAKGSSCQVASTSDQATPSGNTGPATSPTKLAPSKGTPSVTAPAVRLSKKDALRAAVFGFAPAQEAQYRAWLTQSSARLAIFW